MGNWKLFMKSNSNAKLKRPRKPQLDTDLQHPLIDDLLQPTPMQRNWTWWILVAVNSFLLLAGQSAATLLGRFYYDQGGGSKWLQTLTLSAAFPILYLPLLFTPPMAQPPPVAKISIIYIFLGLITAVDSLMYSYGLLYLTVSTFSLVCASQLGFNAVFSYFINADKFTVLTLNSVIVLTFSTAIIGVHSDSESPAEESRRSYVLGFILTLGASALYSLILSLMELSFQKVVKSQSLRAVLDMQIYTALVSTAAAAAGLFASGEWKGLKEDMEGFKKGRVAYVMTVVWTAVAWQVTNVGLVGLISEVSSLFSNVISTLGIPIVPVFAVLLFSEKMDGIKVVSLFLALWGFASYFYQHYIDHKAEKRGRMEGDGCGDASVQ
ncbi:probable purine permease 11 [Typha latifolia]|uniref:probable purine permease 11 n=1 Tax=Typha latifolia TaxID=4733 RepID=UPI003C2D31D0